MDERKIRVLVVDDEADFREIMAFWLESKGYLPISASSGESAIKIIKEEPPDIVFMDLRMPVMDGVETIKKIREFNKDIPIIVISAHLEDPKEKEVLNYNISGIFYKGEDFSQWLFLLETALRRHKKFTT